MMRNRNVWVLICLVVGLTLLAVGCAANEGPASENASQQTEEPKGETIKLYGNDFVDEIAPKFSEDTGYSMEAVHFGGGAALAKIEAEQGNPQWDVLMMDGHGSVRNLANRDFLLTEWVPENIDHLSEIGQSFVPEDHAYTPIGIHASAIIAYNTNILNEESAPKTWDEFFAYEGPVGHADPAVAAPAYPLVSSFFHKWGVEESKEIYTQRFADGLHVYPKNGPVSNALISGEIHVAALQEHNSYQLQLDEEPIGIIWPEEGAPGSLRVIAINKHSKNLEAAKAFVEYMLLPETQNFLTSEEMGNNSFFTPLSNGTVMREEREQNGAFLLPPAEWAAEYENEIKTWFADQNVN